MSTIVINGRKVRDDSSEPAAPAADLRLWTSGRIANLQAQREQLAQRTAKANKAEQADTRAKLSQINAELQRMGVFIEDDDAPAAQAAAPKRPKRPASPHLAHVDLGATLPLF